MCCVYKEDLNHLSYRDVLLSIEDHPFYDTSTTQMFSLIFRGVFGWKETKGLFQRSRGFLRKFDYSMGFKYYTTFLLLSYTFSTNASFFLVAFCYTISFNFGCHISMSTRPPFCEATTTYSL